MKKSLRKLVFRKETIRALSAKDVERAVGGQDPATAFAETDSRDRQCPAFASGQSGDRQCPALVQGG
jgi:hypothetical protein